MATARLRVKSNPAIVAASNAHPDATFEIRGAWPDGETLRLLVETGDVEPEPLRETLDGIPTILDVRRRSAVDGVARFEVATPRPEPHGAMAGSGLVPSFPQTVEGGWIVGELTASRGRLRAFRDELEESGIEYRVEYVESGSSSDTARSRSGRDRLLTDRQREVVELAFDRGYYDYPRACTLTELADVVGVDKSVASRLLQRAEGRIVADFLG